MTDPRILEALEAAEEVVAADRFKIGDKIPYVRVCPQCNGSGVFVGDFAEPGAPPEDCFRCHGKGRFETAFVAVVSSRDTVEAAYRLGLAEAATQHAAKEALQSPEGEAVVLEGELTANEVWADGDYLADNLKIDGKDVGATVMAQMTAALDSPKYERRYGPCLVTVTSIKGVSDE